METIQHIIFDNTLSRIGDAQFADHLGQAYFHDGYCTFERNGQTFRFEAGDCLILARRGDLVMNQKESEAFRVNAIYVTQKFIEERLSEFGKIPRKMCKCIFGGLSYFCDVILSYRETRRRLSNLGELHCIRLARALQQKT